MINKSALLGIVLFIYTPVLFAGGILTNTNQTARFARLICLDASTSIDAAYSNPAGLVMLPEGFHFSISNQSAYQTRNIKTTFAPFIGSPYGSDTRKFKGEASVPIIPSIQAAYRKGQWAISGNIAITGGGGKATFDKGLPMFESPLSMLPAIITQAGVSLPIQGASLSAKGYELDQYMKGSSIIYGAQLGGSYQINDHFSLYGGFRLNIVDDAYEGYLRNLKVGLNSEGLTVIGIPNSNGTLVSPEPFLDFAIKQAQAKGDNKAVQSLNFMKKATTSEGVRLDNEQSGWGISPIIGINFKYEKLNIGMKYEFRTRLNVENKTKIDDTGMYPDGVNTPHDIPGLFTVGVSYQLAKPLMLTAGYHHFFDSEAKMQNNKQEYISGGTDEYLFGTEVQLGRIFLVSAGGQITRYGIKDDFQSDLSFSLNSYSIGFGGAAKVTDKVKINIGYFWTSYSDWTKNHSNYNKTNLPASDVYSRTNKVFAAGVDFSF